MQYEVEEMPSIREVFQKDEDQRKKVSPLHIAFKWKNNRSINTLLKYMGRIGPNCSSTFKDILPKLVEYSNFVSYMEGLPFQTIQM